jgi:hypothetical protein
MNEIDQLGVNDFAEMSEERRISYALASEGVSHIPKPNFHKAPSRWASPLTLISDIS